MKSGYLNKTELNRITRQYRELDAMLMEIKAGAGERILNSREQATHDILIESRNRLGELLRWQSFDVAWKDAQSKPEA